MNAAADLYVAFGVPVSENDVQIFASNGPVYGTPALSANEQHRFGFVENNVTLEISCATPGEVSIFAADPAGRRVLIATGEIN